VKSFRKLAAIMFTDIVGYTAMMGKDESKAVEVVSHHENTMKQLVPAYEGELIQFYGDGSLSIYPSTTLALKCAMKIQEIFRNGLVIPLRIGIHIGEILFKDGNIYGNGVNIASRIESLGKAGTILFSENAFQTVQNSSLFSSIFLGEVKLKNVITPMKVYALSNENLTVPQREEIKGYQNGDVLQESHSTIKEADHIANKMIPDRSIAVLPFLNMSSDPEQEYFCEGISEEIINTLVQFQDLTVVGRTSSFCFKGKNEDLRSVGMSLGVSKILEGSVRKSGNRIRITAQLIEASTGYQLW